MKRWIECQACAFADFRRALGPDDHGQCRIGRPRLISQVSRPVQNALTRQTTIEHGTFSGWPPVQRTDGCGEGEPESKQ